MPEKPLCSYDELYLRWFWYVIMKTKKIVSTIVFEKIVKIQKPQERQLLKIKL